MLKLTGFLSSIRSTSTRSVHIGAIRLSGDKSPLFRLRQRTGLAYNLCREALNKHDNNVDEAEAWLKAHALAHGIQKASKVRDRRTKEGLVCLSVAKENNKVTFVELNCESDFVAKNQVFKDFAIDLTERIASETGNSSQYKLGEVNDLINGLKPDEKFIKELEDQIAPMISKLGENIKLTNAYHLQVTDSMRRTYLFGQIHAQAASKSTDSLDISAGRFGSMMAVRLDENVNIDQRLLKLYGNRLCQHVIGFSPDYIELPDNIRKHLEAVEEERRMNQASQAKDEDGAGSDDEPTQDSRNSRDDWPSIMDQTLILTDDLVVRDFCKNNNLSILYFKRCKFMQLKVLVIGKPKKMTIQHHTIENDHLKTGWAFVNPHVDGRGPMIRIRFLGSGKFNGLNTLSVPSTRPTLQALEMKAKLHHPKSRQCTM